MDIISMSHKKTIQQQIQQTISGGYPIAIMGESGQGKSTSLARLNPQTSFIIDADKKGLPWRGWRKQWIPGQNYVQTSDAGQITHWLNHANRQMPHITTLVIDALSAVMWDSEMARAREKGFEKWTDLAKSVYDIITLSLEVRSNLHIVCIFHSETNRGFADGGENWTKIRTSGKKLDTIVLESKFPIVLLAKSRRDATGNQYFFETQAFCSTAKSPAGMFDQFEIPNDLAAVIASADAYELGEPIPTTSTQLSPSPRPEEIHQLEQDIQKLDPETQQKLLGWLRELGLNSISELQNERFKKLRLRVDQKFRETEIDAADEEQPHEEKE